MTELMQKIESVKDIPATQESRLWEVLETFNRDREQFIGEIQKTEAKIKNIYFEEAKKIRTDIMENRYDQNLKASVQNSIDSLNKFRDEFKNPIV